MTKSLRFSTRLTLAVLFSALACLALLNSVSAQAGTTTPKLTISAVGADPSSGKLVFLVGAKNAQRVTVLYRNHRYVAAHYPAGDQPGIGKSWLARTNLAIKEGVCYHYTVILRNGTAKKSTRVGSKMQGVTSSYC